MAASTAGAESEPSPASAATALSAQVSASPKRSARAKPSAYEEMMMTMMMREMMRERFVILPQLDLYIVKTKKEVGEEVLISFINREMKMQNSNVRRRRRDVS